jgi:phytoene desaturase
VDLRRRRRGVRGRTDHVVVVGAGLSGLSAALRLAGTGRSVTVLERDPTPGGRAGVARIGGYTFDSGPTVLTMPDLLDDAFDCVGERRRDWLTLDRLDPAYRARFADGTTLDVHADPDRMAEAIRAFSGAADAAGYRELVAWTTRLYKAQMRSFIDRNVDSPLGLLTADLARLVAAGGFGRLEPAVNHRIADPRVARLFSFQSMYAGLAPAQALACYAVISYMDSVAGVYFPRGGMHAVPSALAAAAAKHGVELRYGAEVVAVERIGARAAAVRSADGERVRCDALILTADLPTAWRTLLGREPRRLRRVRYSPSCALLLAGSNAAYPDHAHHEINFGHAWGQTFRELIDTGELMSDPSFLVSTPTRSDPTLAPPGRHCYSVLFPTPNLTGNQNWAELAEPYRRKMIATLESRGYAGFGAGIAVSQLVTPLRWAERGLAAGTPFAAAHTFRQTGPFRPRNRAAGWENVVFAGSGTVPGVGIPCVLISGRLAAERITGPDRGYHSRAWRS